MSHAMCFLRSWLRSCGEMRGLDTGATHCVCACSMCSSDGWTHTRVLPLITSINKHQTSQHTTTGPPPALARRPVGAAAARRAATAAVAVAVAVRSSARRPRAGKREEMTCSIGRMCVCMLVGGRDGTVGGLHLLFLRISLMQCVRRPRWWEDGGGGGDGRGGGGGRQRGVVSWVGAESECEIWEREGWEDGCIRFMWGES